MNALRPSVGEIQRRVVEEETRVITLFERILKVTSNYYLGVRL